MKSLLSLLIALVILPAASADVPSLELPKDIFRLGSLEKAKAEATSEKKPLVFLLTREGTEDRGTIARTKGFLEAIDRKTVVVYLGNEDLESKKLPEPVVKSLEELRKREGLLIVPILVATDSAATEAYFTFTTRDVGPRDEVSDALRKKLREFAEKGKK